MISIKLACCVISVSMSGTAQMAPTAKRQKHELELAKMKIEGQENLIKELTQERDFLKEQLSQGKSIITVFHQCVEHYVNIFCYPNNGSNGGLFYIFFLNKFLCVN